MAKLKQAKSLDVTEAQQIYMMRSRFPQFSSVWKRGRSVVWTGPMKPSELSEEYTVEVTYSSNYKPSIAVLAPQLVLAHGHTKLPHVYDGQKAICVYLPEQWNWSMFVADTILPWVSQWLYFYEVWSLTGKWFGKGTHASAPEHSEQ